MTIRPVRVALALCSALLLIATVGFLPVAAASGPSATGGGFIEMSGSHVNFGFSAITHSDGVVTGQFQLKNHSNGAELHAKIDCLNVVGNLAYMSGPVTQLRGTQQSASYVLVVAQDNGPGAKDLIDLVPFTEPVACSQAVLLPANEVIGGNIQVRP